MSICSWYPGAEPPCSGSRPPRALAQCSGVQIMAQTEELRRSRLNQNRGLPEVAPASLHLPLANPEGPHACGRKPTRLSLGQHLPFLQDFWFTFQVHFRSGCPFGGATVTCRPHCPATVRSGASSASSARQFCSPAGSDSLVSYN